MSWLVVGTLFFIGKTHFLDSLQTVWFANASLGGSLSELCGVETLMVISWRLQGRSVVTWLVLLARGQQSLEGHYVCENTSVEISVRNLLFSEGCS